jgi:hypothetical protein
MKHFNFKTGDKIIFYISLLLYKFEILTKVKKGKLDLLLAEVVWVLNGVLKKRFSMPIRTEQYRIPSGSFKVNKDIQSVITLSPSFERLDRDFLKKLIQQDLKKKKKVLFVDVGAHIGLYAVELGNAFKRNSNFSIIAFEPNANNFFDKNFQLLKFNIAANNIKAVQLFNVGLGSKTTKKPNKFGILTVALDSLELNKKVVKFDSVFMKIDIEGFEEDALRGARKFIENCKEFTLLVEDCVNTDVIKYLEKRFDFVRKITPYNSFWRSRKA